MTGDPKIEVSAAAQFTSRYGYVAGRVDTPLALRTEYGPRCRAKTTFMGHQCMGRGDTTLADGTTWCRMHDPKAVENRAAVQAKRAATFKAKRLQVGPGEKHPLQVWLELGDNLREAGMIRCVDVTFPSGVVMRNPRYSMVTDETGVMMTIPTGLPR